MKALKYKIIKTKKQYYKYCNILEQLVGVRPETNEITDEIELLTVLIEKYDEEHNTLDLEPFDPIELLRSLMDDHKMKAKDLAELLGVNKSYVSGILNYKKGLSKVIIRKLANRFAMRQEVFNRPYKLKSASKKKQAA